MSGFGGYQSYDPQPIPAWQSLLGRGGAQPAADPDYVSGLDPSHGMPTMGGGLYSGGFRGGRGITAPSLQGMLGYTPDVMPQQPAQSPNARVAQGFADYFSTPQTGFGYGAPAGYAAAGGFGRGASPIAYPGITGQGSGPYTSAGTGWAGASGGGFPDMFASRFGPSGSPAMAHQIQNQPAIDAVNQFSGRGTGVMPSMPAMPPSPWGGGPPPMSGPTPSDAQMQQARAALTRGGLGQGLYGLVPIAGQAGRVTGMAPNPPMGSMFDPSVYTRGGQ
jgi:hypothetical protein